MKKYLLSLPIILGIIVLISVPSVVAQSDEDFIPEWVKANAGWWSEGRLSDSQYVEGLQWLIVNNIIQLVDPIYMAVEEESPVEETEESPEATAMIASLTREIEKMHIQVDEVEESKDLLEEEFMKKESETEDWYEENMEYTRLQLTKYYEDRIDIIIEDTDTERDESADAYTAFSEKHDKLWDEYQRLYAMISEVRENTNPDDFK